MQPEEAYSEKNYEFNDLNNFIENPCQHSLIYLPAYCYCINYYTYTGFG